MISAPFDWWFSYDLPGPYVSDFLVTLSPLKWEYLTITNSTAFTDHLASLYNISLDAFPDTYKLFDANDPVKLNYNFSGVLDEQLPLNCTFVDTDFTAVNSWADLSNCTRCLSPDRQVRVIRLLDFRPILCF